MLCSRHSAHDGNDNHHSSLTNSLLTIALSTGRVKKSGKSVSPDGTTSESPTWFSLKLWPRQNSRSSCSRPFENDLLCYSQPYRMSIYHFPPFYICQPEWCLFKDHSIILYLVRSRSRSHRQNTPSWGHLLSNSWTGMIITICKSLD